MEVEHVGERAPRWGLGDAALGLLVGWVATAVVLAVWAGADGTTGKNPSLGALAASEAALWLGLLGAPILASRTKGAGDLARDFGFSFRWTDPLVGVPIGVACQLLLVPLIYLPLQQFISKHDLEAPVRQVTSTAHGASYFILTLVVVVGAPVVEELFFRGLVLRSLQRRFGDRWAVAGSAVVFGLAHFEPLQLPALVALGVILGMLAVTTKRLGPSIFTHAGFNLVTMIALWAQR
ncbi:MAG: CPBP family intramembrane metalloprotease [Acidimicrobiia bacterium]|nr:CPBP family intramembrane metalloprotease [Acidimicrobiia bacterium]